MCKPIIKSITKRRIIICDDEKDLLYLYAEVLSLKYNIIVTTTGKECIDKYKESRKESPVDLILVDYRLKDMDGDQVACEINKTNGVKEINKKLRYFIKISNSIDDVNCL